MGVFHLRSGNMRLLFLSRRAWRAYDIRLAALRHSWKAQPETAQPHGKKQQCEFREHSYHSFRGGMSCDHGRVSLPGPCRRLIRCERDAKTRYDAAPKLQVVSFRDFVCRLS